MPAKLTIELFQNIAVKRNGRCLSKTYHGKDKKLDWECEFGHQWSARAGDIKNGSWCPKCANAKKNNHKKLSIEEMNAFASKLGGTCTSTTYNSLKDKLAWKCKEGHEWSATARNVYFNNSWCPICAKKRVANSHLLTIEMMQELAAKRGGICLSKKYLGSREPLKWKCNQGHIFEALPVNVNQGTWCSDCSSYKGELICRAYFEALFGNQFPKKKPEWLKLSNKIRLELDGYCEKLNLAFEHHGEQHYTNKTKFGNKLSDLNKRKSYDLIKRKLCSDHGVTLIEIPELFTRTQVADLRELIKRECKKYKIKIPNNFDTIEIDLNKIYKKTDLDDLNKLAETRGGKLLSSVYLGQNINLEWRCAEGHLWMAPPKRIRQGVWCLQCSGKSLGTISEMEKIANAFGGKCLSGAYVNSQTKLLWQCKMGHEWWAQPSSVKYGHWCPKCAGVKKLSIEEIQDLAVNRGGACISKKYVNSSYKLKWQCEKGHQWSAIPGSVIRGSWCPECAKAVRADKKRMGIEALRKIAKDRGGKCLSEKYKNSQSKLEWECYLGHKWVARVLDVVHGKTWCPECYRKNIK